MQDGEPDALRRRSPFGPRPKFPKKARDAQPQLMTDDAPRMALALSTCDAAILD